MSFRKGDDGQGRRGEQERCSFKQRHTGRQIHFGKYYKYESRSQNFIEAILALHSWENLPVSSELGKGSITLKTTVLLVRQRGSLPLQIIFSLFCRLVVSDPRGRTGSLLCPLASAQGNSSSELAMRVRSGSRFSRPCFNRNFSGKPIPLIQGHRLWSLLRDCPASVWGVMFVPLKKHNPQVFHHGF